MALIKPVGMYREVRDTVRKQCPSEGPFSRAVEWMT
jgi:hypothetical protein